ncbi:MAG: hypothetical protein GXP46_03835 [Deferribacteres bacterium]|nr:hypothetical protein [Deferribacteres bacterium]
MNVGKDDEIRFLKSEIRRLRSIISGLSPSLETMLKCRGFTVYKKEPRDDLLVPEKKYAEEFFEKLKKYSFRLFLRDVIKHQDSFSAEKVSRYATRQVSSQYIDFLLRAGLAESFDSRYRLKKRPIRSFGATLEWFVAGLIEREFQAETLWGVKFRRPDIGGDYDLIARVESLIVYMEIKSSPPKQIYDKEIAAFLKRVEDLAPDMSVFFVDTELRMKDKIVPMFEDALQRRYKNHIPVERIKKELFHINRKIFIINAKGGIASNFGTVLGFLLHKTPDMNAR